MTDKLADAKRALLKISVEADHIYSDEIEAINSFITDHEAAKAATPDDVKRFNARVCISSRDGMTLEWHETPDGTHVLYEDYAALRQGVTLPREVVDALDGIKPLLDVDCPEHPDGDCIGWQGDKEIPVTFGQVRRVLALLDQHARGG